MTLAIIIAVLAGPSVVSCFNADEGMGVCLRAKMTNAGLFPRQAVADAEIPAAPAGDVALVSPAETQAEPVQEPAATAEPEAPATEDQAPAAAGAGDELVAATFGLLRAEPDGSVVIAGSGTPGSEIEVYADEELLGTTTVEPSGDWVIVPDAPIAPGGSEITLAEAGKTGRAEQSFVVVVNEDKATEPLVVASTPGAASEILQGLDRPAEGTTTQVAAADPGAPPPAQPEPTPASAAAAPAEPETPAASAAPALSAPADATPAAEPVADAAATAPASETPAPATAPTPAPAAPEQQATAPAPSVEAPSTTAEVTDQAAAAPAPLATPAVPAANQPAEPATAPPLATTPAPVETPPSIDAIEIENGRTFFAGAGTEGATIRLYVDDTAIADAIVEDGRWLVEAGNVLTKPSQRVRADMLAAGSADVAARAEVNFEVDLPANAPPVAVAQAPTADPAEQPAPQGEATTADRPAQTSTPAQPRPQPEQNAPTAPAITAAPPAQVPAEPQVPSQSASSLAPAPDVDVAAEVNPSSEAPTAAAAVEAAPEAPTAAAPVEADTATNNDTEAESIPTMVAVSVGGPDSERFASGKAIIRRGDNLWTIARRVYGEGIRYTTIYEANTGQIRDPDRIYPGQVFDLPN